MYNTTKWLVRVIGLTVISALCAQMIAVANTDAQTQFTDVNEGTTHSEAILDLADAKILEGYGDGSFQPSRTIQRDEFAKIIAESLGLTDEDAEKCFDDLAEWSVKYVCGLADAEIVQGYDDGLYHPERPINFVEAAKIVTEGVSSEDVPLPVNPLETEWYSGYVYALQGAKAIPTEISKLDHQLTRAEMAEIIWRVNWWVDDKPTKTYAELLNKTDAEIAAALPSANYTTFPSCSALSEHINNTEINRKFEQFDLRSYDYDLEEATIDRAVPTSAPNAAGDGAADTATISESAGAQKSDDFSTTNLQVAGVDEADIVKTDGSYIYVLQGESISIAKANPASELSETTKIEFDDDNFSPNDMYVDGDRLVVIGSIYQGYLYEEDGDGDLDERIMPYYYRDATKVITYDISNPAAPSKLREVETEGNTVSSRKIDDTVYLVTTKSNPWRYIEPLAGDESATILPRIYDSNSGDTNPAIDCDELYYHPGDYSTRNYVIVTAIPVTDADAPIANEVILGGGDNIYSSRDNLYVAETYGNWWWFGNSSNDTIVNKFNLDASDIDYEGEVTVPGKILNQFSMDEHEGNFRIATTKGNAWDNQTKSTNNIYIYDNDLNPLGSLEDLAPGERIYSTRFLGDRVYMVTFKKVDPLFVIDAADPRNPEVLGELKIPGYSDYLHPFDENHIIGFGKDAVDASEGDTSRRNLDFAWYQGVKVAMFDVTDVANPEQLHVELIGDRGSNSQVLYNHKSLLFAPTKGSDDKTLMAFPVTLYEIPEGEQTEATANTYGDFVGQYGYVYDVSVEDGFELREKITHREPALEQYEGSNYNVNRIIYIDDVLYTISRGLIQARSLDDLDDLIKEAALTVDQSTPYYWY